MDQTLVLFVSARARSGLFLELGEIASFMRVRWVPLVSVGCDSRVHLSAPHWAHISLCLSGAYKANMAGSASSFHRDHQQSASKIPPATCSRFPPFLTTA